MVRAAVVCLLMLAASSAAAVAQQAGPSRRLQGTEDATAQRSSGGSSSWPFKRWPPKRIGGPIKPWQPPVAVDPPPTKLPPIKYPPVNDPPGKGPEPGKPIPIEPGIGDDKPLPANPADSSSPRRALLGTESASAKRYTGKDGWFGRPRKPTTDPADKPPPGFPIKEPPGKWIRGNDPNPPVMSDKPMPVEPDGGIGDTPNPGPEPQPHQPAKPRVDPSWYRAGKNRRLLGVNQGSEATRTPDSTTSTTPEVSSSKGFYSGGNDWGFGPKPGGWFSGGWPKPQPKPKPIPIDPGIGDGTPGECGGGAQREGCPPPPPGIKG